MKFWKNEMAPAAIEQSAIEAFEQAADFRLPAAFREHMTLRNGGIVRTGPYYWWLFPIPGSDHKFPGKRMWLGSECPDLPSFIQKAREFTTFPANAVPFGLRLFTRSADGVLCFRRSEHDPGRLKEEVWVWHWYKKPMRMLLERPEDLWRDDPFRAPKPKQNWKAKRQKSIRSPALVALSRGVRGTPEAPIDLGWVNLAPLNLIGRRVAITDGAGSDFDEALCVSLEPGPYAISARLLSFGKPRRIGAVRLVRAGASWNQIVECGSVDVELGSILISDVDPILTCEEMVLEKLFDRLMDLLLASKQFGLLSFGPTTMAQVESGFGDGTYQVFQLLDGNLPVGMEVVFVGAVA